MEIFTSNAMVAEFHSLSSMKFIRFSCYMQRKILFRSPGNPDLEFLHI